MEHCSTEQIQRILSHMGDGESAEVYGYRLLHSLSGSAPAPAGGWVKEAIQRSECGRLLLSSLKKLEGRERILFGAGIWGQAILKYFSGGGWSCFADNDSRKTEAAGLKVIGAESLFREHREAAVVITSRRFREEIRRQLLEGGIREEQIVDAGAMIEDMIKKQYFDLPALRPVDGEVFVDGGCFDGGTSLNFAEWCGGRYEGIYAFEPDRRMYEEIRAGQAGGLERFHLFCSGLWDREETLSFQPEALGSSHLARGGSERVAVTALDRALEGKRVTFIKMDIEGAELMALKGAERLIRENRPRLAVSLYHRPEDVWEIPGLLLSYHQDYTFYLRHYNFNECETVLYAV